MSYEAIDLKCGRCGHGQSQHSKAAGGCGVEMMNNANEVCFCTEFQWAPGQSVERPVSPATTAEELAKLFHERYERLAPSFGYTTHMDTAKPWDEIPDCANKRLMIATCAEVLKSQSEKLVGIGQEAAEKIVGAIWADNRMPTKQERIAEIAAIIDKLVAERLAK